MKTFLKFLGVTLLVGAIAMPLGMMLWPPGAGGEGSSPAPTGVQIGLLMLIAVLEALVFGLGVAFVLFGMPATRKLAGGSTGLSWAMFLSIAWLLLSWLPHSGLHRSMGEHATLWNLLAVEYGFHFTNIVAASVIAVGFVRLLSHAPAEDVASTSAQAELRVQPS